MISDSSTEAHYRLLWQAAEIGHAHGVRYAVLSPGSRSAPVALSFMRHGGLRYFVIPDERSAAYAALGMARQSKSPVALVCTSGTAALNFAPAVAEAFFSEIPLLILTADRPPEWIAQADNQSIYQQGIYARNVKGSFELPVDLAHSDAVWYAQRMINEALILAQSPPFGPVHINIPLREPLYLKTDQKLSIAPPKIIRRDPVEFRLPEDLFNEIGHFEKVLFVAGMLPPRGDLKKAVSALCRKNHMLLLPDVTSNLQAQGSIRFAGTLLESVSEEEKKGLAPDLIISFGGPVVPRSVREFLRQSSAEHWHITPGITAADTYRRLSRIVQAEPEVFFGQLLERAKASGPLFDKNYAELWQKFQQKAAGFLEKKLAQAGFNELKAAGLLLESLAGNCVLHLGNSMPVRLASEISLWKEDLEVYSNRGTSGIDGSLSAAAGQSIVDDRLHVILLGDLSFMYDRNGLWNNYLRPNLRIVVLNNHGGGIFRSIAGPAAQPELEEYFVVRQPLNFEDTAKQHGLGYKLCSDETALKKELPAFLAKSEKPQMLEVNFPQAGDGTFGVNKQ